MAYKLSKPSQTIIKQGAKILSANNLTQSSSSREKAVAVFQFMREEIKFGFTWKFDYATPEETLTTRRGHCNAQSALFASLLTSVGVSATQRFVELSPDVLHGIIPVADKLLHSCVVVNTEHGNCHVDGFIIGKSLFEGAKQLLEREGRRNGYGIAYDGVCEWDGRQDCFVQMTNGVGRDFGVYDEPMKFLESGENFQKLGIGGRLFLAVGTRWINRRIDGICQN